MENKIGTNEFNLNYNFFDDERETKLSMLVNGKNILEYNFKGEIRTTTWNLDELAFWLRNFIDTAKDDPYPVEASGEYAAEKDITARDFDSDDDEEFDAYYDMLDEWNQHHRWHTASAGAILSDIYFQRVGENMEISWNNTDAEDNVFFTYKLGGVTVRFSIFRKEIERFLRDYAMHWFN